MYNSGESQAVTESTMCMYSGLADYVVTVDCCLLRKMYVHYVP